MATSLEARKYRAYALPLELLILTLNSLGAFGITFGLPTLVYLFTFACNDISGCPAPSLLSPRSLDLEQLKREVGWPSEGIWGFASWEASGYVLLYYLWSALLWRVLPGTEVEGVVLSSGGRLKYKFNSMLYRIL